MYINWFERLYFKAIDIFNMAFVRIICVIPYFRFIKETRNTQTPITFNTWFHQKILGKNKNTYWPVSSKSLVTGAKNIYAGIETSPGLMPGCYIQGIGKIYVGDYTQIAPNVGIISANHDLYDNRHHVEKEVRIGKYCWLGIGCLIMPGVSLGDYTIVGAGSVVTKSFSEGYCVIAGNPARLVKHLEKERCVFHKSEHEYNGYIPARKFEAFRQKHLNVDRW
jgi:acetyltransferase-like isoleucine patch superfamily enzyme